MNNSEVVGKKKGNRCLIAVGWILIFIAVLVLFVGLIDYVSWQAKKDNYEKVYVYSNNGTLSYELNGEIIYVYKTYDDMGDSVAADIPDKKTVVMYCEKNDLTSCIYINSNSSTYSNMESPLSSIMIFLGLIAVGLMFILNKKGFSATHLIFVLLFALGVYSICLELYHGINYFNLKNGGILTTATIYSEIYKEDTSSDKYRPVAYYYVDDDKYIFVSDVFLNGSLEENIYTTFEIYYDQSNPLKNSRVENPVNLLILFIGIAFVSCSLPFVFNKKTMNRRLATAIQNNQSKEWKV